MDFIKIVGDEYYVKSKYLATSLGADHNKIYSAAEEYIKQKKKNYERMFVSYGNEYLMNTQGVTIILKRPEFLNINTRVKDATRKRIYETKKSMGYIRPGLRKGVKKKKKNNEIKTRRKSKPNRKNSSFQVLRHKIDDFYVTSKMMAKELNMDHRTVSDRISACIKRTSNNEECFIPIGQKKTTKELKNYKITTLGLKTLVERYNDFRKNKDYVRFAKEYQRQVVQLIASDKSITVSHQLKLDIKKLHGKIYLNSESLCNILNMRKGDIRKKVKSILAKDKSKKSMFIEDLYDNGDLMFNYRNYLMSVDGLREFLDSINKPGLDLKIAIVREFKKKIRQRSQQTSESRSV